MVLQLLVVCDPAADLLHLLAGNDPAGGASRPQRYRQIPDGSMPLPLGTLAGRIPAGDIAFHQGATEDLGDRRELFGQTLPALAEGEFGDAPESTTCLHISASIHQNRGLRASANLLRCEFPPTVLIQKERKLACEVPAGGAAGGPRPSSCRRQPRGGAGGFTAALPAASTWC